MNEEYNYTPYYFGLRLAKLRQRKGISARQMSLEIGQNKNYINSLEIGRSYPHMEHFFDICQYLNITPQAFFQEEAAPTSEHYDLFHDIVSLPPVKCQHVSQIVHDMSEN